MGTREFNAGITLQWTSIPPGGGLMGCRKVDILLVALCNGCCGYQNWLVGSSVLSMLF